MAEYFRDKGSTFRFRILRDEKRVYRGRIVSIAIGAVTATLGDVEELLGDQWRPVSIGLGNCIAIDALLDDVEL